MSSFVDSGLGISRARFSKVWRSLDLVWFSTEKSGGSPRHRRMDMPSICFKSHNNRPMTWPQSRLPQEDNPVGIFFPAVIARITDIRDNPEEMVDEREERVFHACAEGASHKASGQGNLDGNSPRSTIPRRLVRVQRLQSYSKTDHASLFSCSWVFHWSQLACVPAVPAEACSWEAPLSTSYGIWDLNKPIPRRLPMRTPRDLSAS